MRCGVFVDVAEYTDPMIQSISYAASDAVLISDTLMRACEFDQHRSITLTSESTEGKYLPSLENIFAALDRQRRSGPYEAFAFYFSGHGFRSADGTDFLMPHRADTNALEIRLETIVDDCLSIDASRILIIIDACRQNIGGRATFGQSRESLNSAAFRGREVAVFFSASPGSFSFERSDLQAGVFTSVFSKILGPQYHCKTIGQISNVLTSELPKTSVQVGKPEQTPYTLFFADSSVIPSFFGAP